MLINQIIKDIANIEYSLWVVNTYAAGIQQPNGCYITKYFPMSPFVIENMLLSYGSMGCYQQGYKTNRIKWICFDFDCKDKMNPDVYELYKNCVRPFTNVLDELEIKYLTEFSGRRGIHVWIIFKTVFEKKLGYRIVCELEKKCRVLSEIKDNEEWGLDRFPATDTSRGNIVGKQVKFPLSCHVAGERSYFFCGEFQKKEDTESEVFLNEQLGIMKAYMPNEITEVVRKLNIDTTYSETTKLKYRKYCLQDNIEVTSDQVINILSETRVFREIFQRMQQGNSLHQDWLVILGTLYLCDADAIIVTDVFRRFPNYDERKTFSNIEKLGKSYFPATFGYLYRIYGITLEENIDPEETGLHYLLRRCGVEANILQQIENTNEKKTIYDISVTAKKEKNYLKENDEVADVYIWNQLCNLKNYDFRFYEDLIKDIEEGKKIQFTPKNFKVFNRIESEEKTRKLVALSAKERIITTNLALRLCDLINESWKSFSYHISYTSNEYIFYHWYSSWGRYLDHIHVFMDVPFMDNYEVFYIDLKGFYDHIDFLAVLRSFEEVLDEKARNIFVFLTEYNDKLMKKIQNGDRIGVPQGPAYARIIAEMFLDKLLNSVLKKFDQKKIYSYRYVDDMVFFCRPDFDSRMLFDELMSFFPLVGLPVNLNKSKYYGKICDLSGNEKVQILHSDSFNYDLTENDYTGYMLEEEKKSKLKEYLIENPFNVGSLGYIFGKYTISEAQIWCLQNCRTEILSACEGRGSNYRKFYDFLFQNEKYIKIILDNQELKLIPLKSLNFSNFIHTLYYAVQDRIISPPIFERIKEEYLKKILDNELKKDDCIIVKALLLVNAEVANEKS